MLLVSLQGVLYALLIIFFYAFTIVLAFVVVGMLAQVLKLDRKMPAKRLNFFVYTIAATLWIGFAFLVLNGWAATLWIKYVAS